jgi:hypothetical protein
LSSFAWEEKKMKTVTALFEDFTKAKSAVLELENVGVLHNEITTAADKSGRQPPPRASDAATPRDVSRAVGHDIRVGAGIGGVVGLLMGLTTHTLPGFGWIAGTGWLPGLLLGVGVGALAGGLIGALTPTGALHKKAGRYSEEIHRGGALVTVTVADDLATRISQVLDTHGALNIQEHTLGYDNAGFVRQGATDLRSREDQIGNPS